MRISTNNMIQSEENMTNLARHDSMTRWQDLENQRKEFTLTCHHHENDLTMEGFQEGESRWFDHRRRGGWFDIEGKKKLRRLIFRASQGLRIQPTFFINFQPRNCSPYHPFSHHFTFPPFSFSIYAMTKFSPSRIHCCVSYCLCNSVCRILCRLVHVPLYLSTPFIFHLPYSFPHHITFFIASPFISLPHSFVYLIHFCLRHSFYV